MEKRIKRILIVDDSMLLVKRLTLMLHEILPNIEVMNAPDGEDALDMIAHYVPDLVMLDLQLPDMSGVEILKKIREKGFHTSVVVLTNHATAYNLDQCKREGADAFYDKSTQFEEAIQHIQRIKL